MSKRNNLLPPWQRQLWRQRLLDRLDTETQRNFLTILEAPTGCGKTVLLTNFTQQTTFPVCWVHLTGAENPVDFLKLITGSINETFTPVDVRDVWQSLYSGDLCAGIESIKEATGYLPPHLIIIDDLDKTETSSLYRAIDGMSVDPWPRTKFLISTQDRAGMASILDRMGSGFGLIDKEEMAFTPEEIRALLFKRGYEFDLDEVEQIAAASKGDVSRILTIAPVWRHTSTGADYNAAIGHLLSEIEPALALFIRQTSVLPYLNAKLANELLRVNDSEMYLARLKDLELVHQKNGRFEYQEMVVITAKAELSMADRIRYSRRAARIFIENGDYLSAGELCFNLQDWACLLNIIVKYGKDMYQQGHVKLLETWLIEMPEWLFEQQVELMLFWGRLLVNDLSNPAHALELFSRAEMIFIKQSDPIGQARAWAWQSVALRTMGEPDQALRLATEAVARLREWGEKEKIAWSVRLLGLAHRAVGNLPEHFLYLREALALYANIGDPWYLGQCFHDLGVGYAQMGDTENAFTHYLKAVALWEKFGVDNDLSNTLNSIGVNYITVGNPGKAIEYFDRALAIAEQSGAIRRQAFSLAGRGDAYMAIGNEDSALDMYTRSYELARFASARVLMTYSKVRTAEALFRVGLVEQSLIVVEECIRVAEEKRFVYELGLACELKGRIFMSWLDHAGALPLFEQASGWMHGCSPIGVVRNKLRAAQAALRESYQQAALSYLGTALQSARGLTALLPAWRSEMGQVEDMLAHFYTSPASWDGIRPGIELLLGRAPQSETVHLRVLGEAALYRPGQIRKFQDRGKVAKAIEVLAFLAINGPSSKEMVQEALWPDNGLKESYPWFHWALRHLRESYYEGIVTQTDHLYRVNFDWVDAVAFTTLLKKLEAGAGLEARLEAIHLYKGPFLEKFDLSEWGFELRETMTRQFLQQVRLAARELLDLRESEKALNVLFRGLEEDNYQEDLYVMVKEAHEQLKIDPSSYMLWAAGIIREEIGIEPTFSVAG